MFEYLIPRAAKFRCGVTEQESGFVTELISWKMGPSWECRSLGRGRVLKESLCPWSFSLHHLSLFLVHHEINGSPPLCGPCRELTPYHSLEVTEPGDMGWSHWTHESKQGALPWTWLSQMFLSQWQKLPQFPTLCPPVSDPAFHH